MTICAFPELVADLIVKALLSIWLHLPVCLGLTQDMLASHFLILMLQYLHPCFLILFYVLFKDTLKFLSNQNWYIQKGHTRNACCINNVAFGILIIQLQARCDKHHRKWGFLTLGVSFHSYRLSIYRMADTLDWSSKQCPHQRDGSLDGHLLSFPEWLPDTSGLISCGFFS